MMDMTHSGMPYLWAAIVLLSSISLSLWRVLGQNTPLALAKKPTMFANSLALPYIQDLGKTSLINILRLIFVLFFLFIIYAGLLGSQIPNQNIATVSTWLLWWTGIIIAVLFTGSLWCALCPWDNLASWLHTTFGGSLELRVPKALRSIWPATLLLVLLSWLELGFGVTASPYATSLLALALLIAVLFSQGLFKRKAFCRYFCPIGRTIGLYAQLSPVGYAVKQQNICDGCTSLECYHGTHTTPACPTQLVIGRMKEAMFCTSCGACQKSCTKENVIFGLHPVNYGANRSMRLRHDVGVFIIILMALTSFHGLSMLPAWESSIKLLAGTLGDRGLLVSFSTVMILMIVLVFSVFYFVVSLNVRGFDSPIEHKKLFTALAISMLPLAFSYHIAHNLNHLLHDNINFMTILLDPFGRQIQTMHNMTTHGTSGDIIYFLQSLLLILGFWFTSRILSIQLHRFSSSILRARQLLPGLSFALLITLFNLWLLTQPMSMRM